MYLVNAYMLLYLVHVRSTGVWAERARPNTSITVPKLPLPSPLILWVVCSILSSIYTYIKPIESNTYGAIIPSLLEVCTRAGLTIAINA